MHAPDVLTQSSPDEVEEVLKSLMGVEEQSASTCLELWVENLREWLSKQVRGERRWAREGGRMSCCKLLMSSGLNGKGK